MKKYYSLNPSIGGSFSYGWRTMFGKAFLTLLLTVVIAVLLNGPVTITWKADEPYWFNLIWGVPIALVGLAYAFLIKPVINYGIRYLFLKAMREEEAELRLVFEGFRSKYIKIVLANLIVVALAIIGFVLLIVPGIIVLVRLVFVPYLIMDKEIEPMQAIEKSWALTRGHGWKIFWMAVISFFIIIAGFIALLVGILLSFMWIHSAFATLYQSVIYQSEDENPIPILGVNEFGV